MDGQSQNSRSVSGNHQNPPEIKPSSSVDAFSTNESTRVGLESELQQHRQSFNNVDESNFDVSFTADDFMNTNQPRLNQPFSQGAISNSTTFDPSTSLSQQTLSSATDPTLAFNQSQQGYGSQTLSDSDFSLFSPASGQGDHFNAPLFEQASLSPNDLSSVASPQSHHSTTPPGLLNPDMVQRSGSAQHSPSYNQQQFSSPPQNHSRNVSLTPESALMSNQLNEWDQPQFQGHRRSPSEYSDVSSAAPSPNLLTSDSFDQDHISHSPLQGPSDGSMYQEVLGIGTFSIADVQRNNPGHQGVSPLHSPARSPQISPQNLPDLNQQYGLAAGYGAPLMYPTMQGPGNNYAAQTGGPDLIAPSINIDFAPNNSKQGTLFDISKSQLDQDSLAPPERGRPKSRPRSVTDPFQPGGASMGRHPSSGSSRQSLGADLTPQQDPSRSLSPLDRRSVSSSSSARRRQSTSSVPNNLIALRLVDPEYQSSQEAGSAKRVQKHPATFQCTLCPKRFTRAYNLRSHLRTHTDERPFVCTVCGKAFARQHDRKRHESLHSGEKKFICKGDLKAGGQWGCGRRFARADALGRHFRSEAGRICIKPLLDEEMVERQKAWQEERMQQDMAQNLVPQQGISIDAGPTYPMDANGNYALPAALLAQYPALAQISWSGQDIGSGIEDDLSGRSSFDASDYDECDEGGYVSGPGPAYVDGGMNQSFGEIGYTSDLGGR